MGTISSLLNIAQQALLADQAGLNVTANNVANQATVGYTRESVTMQAEDVVSLNGASYGDGVTASAPQSQRNRVLEQQVQQQMQVQSQSAAVEGALNQVQNVFGISSTSASSSLTQMGTSVDGFFSALTALASDPSDTATREGVLSAASDLASTFNSTSAQLTAIGSSLNSQVGTIVGQANTLTAQIASLNQQISVVSPNGDAGVLEDQRQEAIEQLSQLVGLDQISTSANGIDLTTSNGGALVSGSSSYPLSTAVISGQTQIYLGGANLGGVSTAPGIVALASVGGSAAAGTHTVVVNSLATPATANSAVLTDPTSVLSGTLSLGTTTLTVSAANGNNTLATLAQAINTASLANNLGVTASVTTTGSGSSLALTSPGTAGQTLLSGLSNALTYTTLTNSTPTALVLTPGSTGVDASLTVDGVAVSSPTNNVSNVTGAIPGVSFTALATGTSQLQIYTPITGGQLGGTLEVLNQQLPTAQSSIDSLAYAIASAVNTQNSAGVDANGNPGADLFTLDPSVTGAAASIAVTTTNPQLVAAAASGEGSSGNTNASALAALANTALLGSETADQYLSSTLAQIGESAAAATSNTTVQQAALTQLTTERDSISAVSLDTEASNLTLYQRSYQAASQVFSIVDTLLASAINLGVEVPVS
jgi:flagellar hook-associated protein 1 FlgK